MPTVWICANFQTIIRFSQKFAENFQAMIRSSRKFTANIQATIRSSRKFAANFIQAMIRSLRYCTDNLPTVFCRASTSSSWWWWVLCFRRAWTSSASWTLRSYCCFIWRNLEMKKYPVKRVYRTVLRSITFLRCFLLFSFPMQIMISQRPG